MFKLLGRKREAKDAEPKQQPGSDGDEGAEEKGNTVKLLDKLNGVVEQRGVSSSASVRSIIKAAISSAEQIVDSVKEQVVAEARQEAAKIILEAKKEAEKIESRKKPVQKETAEETVAVAEQVAEEPVPTPEEVVAEAEEPVPTPEEVVAEAEEPVPASEEAVAEEEKPEPPEGQVEEPVAEEEISSEEPAIVEPSAEVTEPEKAGKKRGAEAKEAPPVVLTTEESQTPYTGEVELNVEVPIEPTMVAKLYNYLQTTPEIKFVRTTGSWNKGSTISILLDKPLPLLAHLIAKLPEADISPEGKDHVKDRRRVRRITISPRS